ncbi:MAG: hypothetical protein U0457_10720 [Candidatus Sericytochromatia bacterium]
MFGISNYEENFTISNFETIDLDQFFYIYRYSPINEFKTSYGVDTP